MSEFSVIISIGRIHLELDLTGVRRALAQPPATERPQMSEIEQIENWLREQG